MIIYLLYKLGGGGRFIGSFMEELGAKIYQEHVIFNQLMKKNTLIKRGVSLPFIENTKNERKYPGCGTPLVRTDCLFS